MSEFEDFMAAGLEDALGDDNLGAEPMVVNGLNVTGLWTDVRRSEEFINGRNVATQATVISAKAQFGSRPPREGMMVVRLGTGEKLKILGDILTDEISYTFDVDSRHK